MSRRPDKRVLIMSASAGTGHGRAGEALVKAFADDPRVAQVIHRDALRYTNKLFRDFYSRLYTQLVRSAPDFLGWWYKTSDEPWKTDPARLALDRLNTRPLVELIQRFDPHITVCTHFMPAGIMSHLITRQQLRAHLSIVVTDLDFHAMWLSRAFHRYFVAIDETRAYLEALGLPGERVTVSGIPIDPQFGARLDREATCRAHGLDPARPILLVSAGALGVSPTEFLVCRLLQLRPRGVQVIVICGQSDELRGRVDALVAEVDHPRFLVLGYTNKMHELMKVADLFVGKPGGLTTAEALACGLPMVIVSPIPGQEERNSDHLLEDGVAIKCNEMVTVPFKVDRLLDDPGRLAAMRRNALALARPDAARVVARTLLEDHLPTLEIDAAQRAAIAAAAAPSDGRAAPAVHRSFEPPNWLLGPKP